jgi:hypothetical protein
VLQEEIVSRAYLFYEGFFPVIFMKSNLVKAAALDRRVEV